jgi:hypothetical protein
LLREVLRVVSLSGWIQELLEKAKRLAIEELCCRYAHVFFGGESYSEKDQWWSLCTLRIVMAYDGGFERGV